MYHLSPEVHGLYMTVFFPLSFVLQNLKIFTYLNGKGKYI